jgi:hypothetical protein
MLGFEMSSLIRLSMNQRALIISGIIFLLVIGGMFGYAALKRAELNKPHVVVPQTPEVEDASQMRVNAVHFFKDGTHTVVGDLMVPTPCDLIQAEAIVAESMPEQVTIQLTTINNDDTCAQVMTLQRFRVEFEASMQATIRATLDGKGVLLNLRDAEPGTEPDKLEDLYFKG